MVTHRKKTYLFIVSSLFIALIFASTLYINNNFTSNGKGFENEASSKKVLNDKPLSSNLNLTDYISGSGLNQTVRVYMVNKSTSKNNRNYFDIPSPADKTYLSYGDFNFTFQNNYTTNYVIESNSSLYPVDFVAKYKFNTNSSYSRVEIVPKMNKTKGSLYNLTDTKGLNSYWTLNSSTNGLLNFTVYANFSKIANSGSPAYLPFNRSNILGFLLSLSYNVSKAVNITIKMFDFNTLAWENVTTPNFINSTSIQYLNERAINENLNYINSANTSLIQFIFSRTDLAQFNVSLFDLNINSTIGFELPITTQNQVALEFDLKGERTTINGFYAWIRTLNLQKAIDTSLNITLYRANATIDRTQTELRKNNLKPDNAQKIDSILVEKYQGDKLSYFAFNTVNTVNLSLYNYFIVIKANKSDSVYSLATLPYYDFGDSITEQELKTSTTSGSTWINAKKAIGSYTSGQLDASQFKLNVTRGYMPSDFKINNTITLNIQNITLEDYMIDNVGKSDLTWGLGRWKTHNFTVVIGNNTQLKFRVPLSWNNTIVKGFKFNVTYLAESYRVENALSSYNATYNGVPIWTLNYTLNLAHSKFNSWNFTEFWFIYLDYLTPHNLTTPEKKQMFDKTKGESVFLENTVYDKVVVINGSAPLTVSGSYLLNLTSPNIIYRTISYINFNGTLWETNGFMFGDNISVSMEIQDQYQKAPSNGTATVSLFFPNGTKYVGHEFISNNSSILKKLQILSYAFDNHTILNVTKNIPVQGEYVLGYFWTNGSAIGCKKMTIYISAYDVEIKNCTFYPNLGLNILSGNTRKVSNLYSLLIASVNETTGKSLPNYYPVNLSTIFEQFTYEYANLDFPVGLISFLQNETILNPGEKVNFKVTVQNWHSFIDLRVKVRVQLVSYANPNWIISEATSANKIVTLIGSSSDTQTFNINLTIPSLQSDNIWKGINAPVRKGGAKTVLTIYVEDTDVGTYDPQAYSLLVNQTENQYEGYIYALKTTLNTNATALLKDFSRDECLYLPENTSFVINIYDQNYVSSYNQFERSFSFKTDSKFTTPSTNPEHPKNGQTFRVASYLTTEFDEALSGNTVTCSYYSDSSWYTITTNTTNAQGLVTYDISTLDLALANETTRFRLSWNGNGYVLQSLLNFTINFTLQSNQLSIGFKGKDKNVVYKETDFLLSFAIRNIGESVLKINEIKLKIDEDLEYEIVSANNLLLNRLNPDESVTIQIIVKITDLKIKFLNITIIIEAQNIISTEIITEDQKIMFVVLDESIFESFFDNDYLTTVLIVSLFIIILMAALIFRRHITKKLQKPVAEEPIKKAPRRAKYATVAEIEAEKAAQAKQEKETKPIDLKEEEKLREAKKKSEEPEPEKKKINLDALIKEEQDKKKEPKK